MKGLSEEIDSGDILYRLTQGYSFQPGTMRSRYVAISSPPRNQNGLFCFQLIGSSPSRNGITILMMQAAALRPEEPHQF